MKCKEQHEPGKCQIDKYYKKVLTKISYIMWTARILATMHRTGVLHFLNSQEGLKTLPICSTSNNAQSTPRVNVSLQTTHPPQVTHTYTTTDPSSQQIKSYTNTNAWNTQQNKAKHHFPDNANNNNIGINTLLTDFKNQIVNMINSQFEKIQRSIEIQTIRMNYIYESLGLEDGH